LTETGFGGFLSSLIERVITNVSGGVEGFELRRREIAERFMQARG
jgi:hypothetical protein